MTCRLITIAAAVFAASACNVGATSEERDPGESVNRSYQISAFDRIAVAGPFEVTVTTSGKPGVRAIGGDKLLDETEVVVEGNVLKIRPKKRNGINFGWGKTGKAKFTVTTDMLHGAAIGGSGGIKIDKVDGDFRGVIGGSGDLVLAAVKGGAIDFVIG